MEYDHKIESFTFFNSNDYQNKLTNQAAFGWEVVNSQNETNRSGQRSIVTFKRNQSMVSYQNLVKLEQEFNKLRDEKISILAKSAKQAEKNLKSLPIQEVFRALLFVGALVLYFITLIAIYQTITQFTVGILISVFIYLVLGLLAHYFSRKWKNSIIKKSELKSYDEMISNLTDRMNDLVSEANRLDHSIEN